MDRDRLIKAAAERGDWSAIVELVDTGPGLKRVSFESVVLAARAHRLLGLASRAVEVLELGVAQFGPKWPLTAECMELALSERGPSAALDTLVDAGSGTANPPPWFYARKGLLEEGLGRHTDADETLAAGRRRYRRSLSVDRAWAEQSMLRSDRMEAVRRWDEVLVTHGDVADAEVYLRSGDAYLFAGRLTGARRRFESGVNRFPDDPRFVSRLAQVAMSDQDWERAVVAWSKYVLMRQRSKGEVVILPEAGRGWPRHSWIDLVATMHDGHPDPDLRSWLKVLVPSLAMRLEKMGEFGYALMALELIDQEDASADVVRCRGLLALEGERRSPGAAIRLGAEPGRGTGSTSETFLQHLEQVRPSGEHGGLGSIWVLDVPYGSVHEREIRSGWYLTDYSLAERANMLSERDGWPELRRGLGPLAARSRSIGRAFGRRMEVQVGLPPEVASEALHLWVYQELCGFEPARRIAADLAAVAADSPVFILADSRRATGFGSTANARLYLLLELRSRGVNAFLVRWGTGDEGAELSSVGFTLPTAVRSYRGASTPVTVENEEAVLIPSLMRALPEICDEVGHPVVYGVGQRVPNKDDRFVGEAGDLCLSPDKLVETKFDLQTVLRLETSGDERAAAIGPVRLSRTESIGGDWIDLLCRSVGPYLADVRQACEREVDSKQVQEVHMADHLSPEAAIMAWVARQRAATVSLWPHSSAPVDVRSRRAGSFDVVRAITRSGADRWKSRFPTVDVRLAPSLLLSAPVKRAWDPTGPVSVIVIGGTTHIGLMPFVHMADHLATYRRLSEGLDALTENGGVEVYVKPKKSKADQSSEAWLRGLVGDESSWRITHESLGELALPNMIFVSVSMGSTALLEGLARGVPAIVVKEAAAFEYTTVKADMIPHTDVPAALDLIASASTAEGYERLLRPQLNAFCQETGYPSPS